MSFTETYTLAHTARCKLKIAADRPDRNLRFILGHAFTLDKLRLRLAEIEMDSAEDEDSGDEVAESKDRHVSFRGGNQKPVAGDRRRSPPPDQLAHQDEKDSESSDDEYDDEEDDNGLSLQRFASATAKPPQMIDDDSSSSDEDDPKSPPPMMPSEAELKMLTEGDGSEELSDLYRHVAGCRCHGESAPAAEQVWEVPQKSGHQGPRIAIVRVAA